MKQKNIVKLDSYQQISLNNKVCTRCNINKALNEFHKNKRNKDGLCVHCKQCQKIADQEKIKKEKLIVYFKKCTRCNIEKNVSKFSRSSRNKDGFHVWCKNCNKLYRQEYYSRPHIIKKERERHRKSYGLTNKEYTVILNRQNGVCAICKNKETKKDWRTKKTISLAIDHNHLTGEVRGLLCERCNRRLGTYERMKKEKIWDLYLKKT